MHNLDPRNTGIVNYYRGFVVPYFTARFAKTERGASLVEYALLVALIAVVCIAAVSFIGRSGKSQFNKVGSSINAAT